MDQIDIRVVEKFFSTSGSKIYDIAEKTVIEHNMQSYIESGVLVGLSGGADSVILLCFLLEYRRRVAGSFTIACAHINHGIRGVEADGDEAFCKELCSALGVEIVTRGYDVPSLARSCGQSIEEAARSVRYIAFEHIIQGRDEISCVATAHNRSDSAETVIFNILRGSGARGASGIRPIRDNIIRPLINVSKDDITSAISDFGIPYVVDSTNLSDEYSRNYIRHKVIPGLKSISSDPEKMLSRFADNMRCDDDFITGVADAFLKEHPVITNRDLSSLHYSVYIRVLSAMTMCKKSSVSFRIAADIHALLDKDNFSYSLIGGSSFVCERGVCRVSRATSEGYDFCFGVDIGETDLSPMNAVFVLSNEKIDKTYSNVYKISIQANLSSAIINGNLYLRPKNNGDSVFYGGMTHKVKKLFSDAKIPVSKRGLIPILCDDSGVVWVPGFGVRDDGVPLEKREDLYVMLGIKDSEDSDSNRLYSASEFRT